MDFICGFFGIGSGECFTCVADAVSFMRMEFSLFSDPLVQICTVRLICAGDFNFFGNRLFSFELVFGVLTAYF